MTKPLTQASYEARLNRVTVYLYEHLDEDIRPEHLAEIACLSAYHWHRIYAAMRGETLSATIRRLRLQRAADRLANSDAPIDAVASSAGYGSADAFARAFKDVYGRRPPRTAPPAAMRRSRRRTRRWTQPVFLSRWKPCRPFAARAWLTSAPTCRSTAR
jgi:transcriptional regulator GlxA family with amidase domain